MKRRDLVRALGTGAGLGLAGCAGVGAPSGDEVRRRLSVEGVRTVPDRFDTHLSVELLEPNVTDQHAAQLRTELENVGEPREYSVRPSESCRLFEGGDGRSDPFGLHLFTDAELRGVESGDRRWSYVGNLASGDGLCTDATLPAGESITTTYSVWEDGRVPGYFPPDTYEFATVVSVGGGDDGPSTFEWGFTLGVAKPE